MLKHEGWTWELLHVLYSHIPGEPVVEAAPGRPLRPADIGGADWQSQVQHLANWFLESRFTLLDGRHLVVDITCDSEQYLHASNADYKGNLTTAGCLCITRGATWTWTAVARTWMALSMGGLQGPGVGCAALRVLRRSDAARGSAAGCRRVWAAQYSC